MRSSTSASIMWWVDSSSGTWSVRKSARSTTSSKSASVTPRAASRSADAVARAGHAAQHPHAPRVPHLPDEAADVAGPDDAERLAAQQRAAERRLGPVRPRGCRRSARVTLRASASSSAKVSSATGGADMPAIRTTRMPSRPGRSRGRCCPGPNRRGRPAAGRARRPGRRRRGSGRCAGRRPRASAIGLRAGRAGPASARRAAPAGTRSVARGRWGWPAGSSCGDDLPVAADGVHDVGEHGFERAVGVDHHEARERRRPAAGTADGGAPATAALASGLRA